MNYKLIEMNIHGDHRGKLVVAEANKDIPFEIKRVYWIYDTLTNEERGHHSHIDMEQVVVAINGSCEFELDDGSSKVNVSLDKPNVGLYIGKNIWRVIKNFSHDCKLIVLASDYYDESEYIRDYNEFLRSIKK